jgi:hypothetical protein
MPIGYQALHKIKYVCVIRFLVIIKKRGFCQKTPLGEGPFKEVKPLLFEGYRKTNKTYLARLYATTGLVSDINTFFNNNEGTGGTRSGAPTRFSIYFIRKFTIYSAHDNRLSQMV